MIMAGNKKSPLLKNKRRGLFGLAMSWNTVARHSFLVIVPPALENLIEKSWLFVFKAQLFVNGCHDTLHLTEGEHTTEEGVACIMTV